MTTALAPPLTVEHGRFVATAIAPHHHSYPVIWVRVASRGEALVFRRGLGVLDRDPEHWPRHEPPGNPAFSGLALDPVRLLGALKGAGPDA